MIYIANAFSLQMLTKAAMPANIKVEEVTPGDIHDAIEAEAWLSAIGHPDTAQVVSKIIGCNIPANRFSIDMVSGDIVYVAQVIGGRLPEGTTILPDGVSIAFYKVTV